MKKKILCTLPLILCLLSCQNNQNSERTLLTYGSLIDDGITYINKSELNIMMLDEENFILVLYPGEDSTCGCWTVFRDNLNQYAKDNERIIYAINSFLLMGNSDDSYGLTLPTDRPSLVVMENGSLKQEWVYNARDTQKFFTSSTYLEEHLNEYTISPKLIYIDEELLNEYVNVSPMDDFNVLYTWKSCSDCTYCLPNAVFPFIETHNSFKKLYVIDLEVEGLLLEDGVKNRENENYLNFLNEYGLTATGNQTFGYDRGFVPTFQHYEKGVLKDADTYFNDAISLVGEKYIVTRTFFTEERINNLNYLNNFTGTKVLEGLEIEESDLNITSNSVSWKKEAAAQYHNPLLEAFLSTYLLG